MDFDNGVHRSVNRQDAVLVNKWSDVSDIKASDIAEYDTIIIDTVGKMLDAMTVAIIEKARETRSKVRVEWEGALTQNGWPIWVQPFFITNRFITMNCCVAYSSSLSSLTGRLLLKPYSRNLLAIAV